MEQNDQFIIYQSEDGDIRIDVKFSGETVWLSQQQMAELYQTSRSNVVEHIRSIYKDGELDEKSTCRKFRQVRQEGTRKVSREIPFYNLDMIISLGYRVHSVIATRFRIWATERLKKSIVKNHNRNSRYWEKMTIRSTMRYCKLMLWLSENPFEKVAEDQFKQRCEEYLRKVIEYDRENILYKHLAELQELSPFPSDLQGFLHEYSGDGIFQPKHLMCKILTLRAERMTFEFIVEYGLLEPDVEIYYGIKAISDSTSTTDEFADRVEELSDKWFDYIRPFIKERGRTAGYYHRHNFTNNVQNGTFWISWVRIEPDEELDEAVRDLEKKVYKKFILFLAKENIIIKQDYKASEKQAFVDAYRKLNSSISGSLSVKLARALAKTKEKKYADMIAKLDDACEFKIKDSNNGETLLVKLENGCYQFNINDDLAWLFVQILFQDKDIRELAKQYYSDKELIKKYHRLEHYLKAQNSLNAKDRKWAIAILRSQSGSIFEESFFKRGNMLFDDEKTFNDKIKLIMKDENE